MSKKQKNGAGLQDLAKVEVPVHEDEPALLDDALAMSFLSDFAMQHGEPEVISAYSLREEGYKFFEQSNELMKAPEVQTLKNQRKLVFEADKALKLLKVRYAEEILAKPAYKKVKARELAKGRKEADVVRDVYALVEKFIADWAPAAVKELQDGKEFLGLYQDEADPFITKATKLADQGRAKFAEADKLDPSGKREHKDITAVVDAVNA